MAKPIDGLKTALDNDSDDTGEMMSVPKHDVYQDADQGPFRCDHCEYFSAPNKCSHPEIIKLRRGVVKPASCCDYFEKDGN